MPIFLYFSWWNQVVAFTDVLFPFVGSSIEGLETTPPVAIGNDEDDEKNQSPAQTYFYQKDIDVSHIISYHLISSHIISYHLISSHIISYHLISSHMIRVNLHFPMGFPMAFRRFSHVQTAWFPVPSQDLGSLFTEISGGVHREVSIEQLRTAARWRQGLEANFWGDFNGESDIWYINVYDI